MSYPKLIINLQIVNYKSIAGPTGFEPATSALTGQRSNQLSYDPLVVKFERIIANWRGLVNGG